MNPTTDLVYKPSFFDCYKANLPDMDHILQAVAWRFRSIMDPQDLKQEMILRMHQSKFLAKYNPALTSLSTYIMQNAIWTAEHAADSQISDQFVMVDPEGHRRNGKRLYRTKPGEVRVRRQVLAKDLNCPNNEDDHLLELAGIPEIEAEIDVQKLLERVNSRLDETSRKVLSSHLQGFSYKEISDVMGCSTSYIGHKSTEIKRVFRKLMPVKNPKVLSGNNHRISKVRDLTVNEKNRIRNELFIPANGMISSDACVAFKAKMSVDVTIFQITGQIVSLHRKVAKGEIILRRLDAYNRYLDNRRKLWASYDSPRYRKMRDR
jgi:RNA polymerase sigma factor (sigma-70 family)